MRCHPRRWLWGILPIAILTWITVLAEHERIEKDLRARTEQALAAKGLTAAMPNFDGRDGVVLGRLSGTANTVTALETARDVWGVRRVESRLTDADRGSPVKSYVWSASVRNDRLKISGYVPNEATQKAILGVAKAAFPKIEISDRMKFAPSDVPQGTWLAGVSFALEQLSRLRRGTVYLDGERLSLAGVAATPADFTAFRSAFDGKKPSGIEIASDRVTPPSVNPFIWEAKVQDRRLILEGYVPNDGARREILAIAKSSQRYVEVVDKTEIASGAPSEWSAAVRAILAELHRIKSGFGRVDDGAVKIGGNAATNDDIDAVRKSVESGMPKSFEVAFDVNSDETRQAATREAERKAEADRLAEQNRMAEAERLAEADRKLEADLQAAAEDARRKADEIRLAEAREAARLDEEARAKNAKATEEADRARLAEEAEQSRKAREAELERERELAAASRSDDTKTAATDVATLREPTAPLSPEADRCQQSLRDVSRTGVIEFDRSSADLEPTSLPALNELARLANQCRDVTIEVEGHTDAEGTPERNMRLSQRRAASVVGHLTQAGVESARLIARGYGETRPVASNETSGERARNRRIEFTVLMK